MNDSHALTVDEAGDGRPALFIHGRFDPYREAALGVVPVGRVPPPPEPDLVREDPERLLG
jgi:hypothetical protein